MSAWDHYEYEIAGHFASALINGDYSGLDDKEEAQLNRFIAIGQRQIPEGTASHWTCEDDDGDYFTRCDVTGLMAMCITCQLHFQVQS